jgi:hypothetical protein
LLLELSEVARAVRQEHGLVGAAVDDLGRAGREERRDPGTEQLGARDEHEQDETDEEEQHHE